MTYIFLYIVIHLSVEAYWIRKKCRARFSSMHRLLIGFCRVSFALQDCSLLWTNGFKQTKLLETPGICHQREGQSFNRKTQLWYFKYKLYTFPFYVNFKAMFDSRLEIHYKCIARCIRKRLELMFLLCIQVNLKMTDEFHTCTNI